MCEKVMIKQRKTKTISSTFSITLAASIRVAAYNPKRKSLVIGCDAGTSMNLKLVEGPTVASVVNIQLVSGPFMISDELYGSLVHGPFWATPNVGTVNCTVWETIYEDEE